MVRRKPWLLVISRGSHKSRSLDVCKSVDKEEKRRRGEGEKRRRGEGEKRRRVEGEKHRPGEGEKHRPGEGEKHRPGQEKEKERSEASTCRLSVLLPR